MRINFFVLLFFLFLTGCASSVKLPKHRYNSPEAGGHLLAGNFDFTFGPADNIDIVDAAGSITPAISKQSSYGWSLNLGLTRSLDAYGGMNMNYPNVVGLKWQVLGEPGTAARQGNFSMSLGSGLIFGSQNDTLVGGTTVEHKYTGFEIMVPIGYRVNNSILLFALPRVASMGTKSAVKYVGTPPAGSSSSISSTSVDYGLLVGAQMFAGDFYTLLGMGLGGTNWNRTEPTENKLSLEGAVYQIGFGWSWGSKSLTSSDKSDSPTKKKAKKIGKKQEEPKDSESDDSILEDLELNTN